MLLKSLLTSYWCFLITFLQRYSNMLWLHFFMWRNAIQHWPHWSDVEPTLYASRVYIAAQSEIRTQPSGWRSICWLRILIYHLSQLNNFAAHLATRLYKREQATLRMPSFQKLSIVLHSCRGIHTTTYQLWTMPFLCHCCVCCFIFLSFLVCILHDVMMLLVTGGWGPLKLLLQLFPHHPLFSQCKIKALL